MTPRDAERLIHRRARALAGLRVQDRAAGLEVLTLCEPEGGRWQARAVVREGIVAVVEVAATGDDPTAALLALPDALAQEIEATIARLRAALSEAVDGAELVTPEEPATPKAPRPRRARTQASSAPSLEVIGGRDG